MYDLADRLISRTQTPAAGAPRTTLYFYLAGSDTLAEETDGQGAALTRYVVDADQDTLGQLSFRTASDGHKDPTDTAGTYTWMLDDTNGNAATHITDDGAVQEQSAFDPYGKLESGGSGKKPAAPGSSLGYQKALTDKTTGNLLLGPRQYDPTTQRFTTADTYVASSMDMALGTDELTGNRYLFAAANPVSYYEDGHHPNKCPKKGKCDDENLKFTPRNKQGQIRIGLFIPKPYAAQGALYGDNRSWDWHTNPANNRVYLDIHLDEGKAFISAQATCTTRGKCKDALPWNASKGRSNTYSISELDDGTLEIVIKARNSALPGPPIDATFRIDPDGNITYRRDGYPSLEVYSVRNGHKAKVYQDPARRGGGIHLVRRSRFE